MTKTIYVHQLIVLGYSILMAEYLSYILCYFVLINASVIPENGHPKADMITFIELLKTVKYKVNKYIQKMSASKELVIAQKVGDCFD